MKKFYLLFLLALITATGFAQVELVKDINTGTDNGSPTDLYVFNNQIYFKANNGTTGLELWKSDGTEAGTVLIKDIKVGTLTSGVSNFFELNNELYFSAKDGSVMELWKTDGTEAGTVKVLPGVNIFNPVKAGNLIYFANTTDGNKLYQFDGTSATAVANLGTGTESVIGGIFTAINDKLVLYMDYSEDEPTIGRELYEYDPSTDLFTLLKDVTGDATDAGISNMTSYGTEVYFEALNTVWVYKTSDGTTTEVASIASESFTNVNNFYAWNDYLFFEGDNGAGDQLWAYSITGGTVANLSNLTGTNVDHDPSDYCPYGDYLYYRGEDANDTNGHLWRTDGTMTEQLDATIIDIDDIVLVNHVLYFEADESGVTGNELFSYDLRKTVEFTVTDGTNPIEGATITLSGYDAVTSNASGVATINNVIQEENIAYTVSHPDYFDVDGTITVADDNIAESVSLILKIDGNLELVKDINPGTGNSSPANLFVFNNTIFFAADDADAAVDHGKELWKSDGTTEGTVFVKDIRVGADGSSPFNFFEFKNELYFSAYDGTSTDLWKTDGTESGTVNLTIGSSVDFPAVTTDLVYYKNSVAGNLLYEFNGTAGVECADVGAGDPVVYSLKLFGDVILLYMNYSTDKATYGNELYKYDPATDAFTLVKDIAAGTGNSGISNFTELDSKIYFEAVGNLWVTDGTEANTMEVPAAAAANIGGVNNIYAWNNLIFLEGDDGTGDQLWVYDPVAGTVTNLSNLTGTNTNHDPSDYCAYGDYLYYRGEDADDTNGHLWRTDGTMTEQLDNTIIDIDDIVLVNHTLYFEGEESGVTGNELFKLYVGGYYDVTFTVTDGTNPVEGATVALSGYNTATTNASGVAVFTDVMIEDNIAYTVSKDAYDNASGTVNVVDANVDEAVTLNLTTYDVTFTVTDGTDALQGATVTLTGYNAVTTDAGGIATVTDVVPDADIAYTVTLTGYDDASGTVSVVDANVNEAVTLNLTTYDVTFTVTDGTNALQGATVTLTGYTAVTTDASGIAIVTDVVPATDIAYTVTLTGYDDASGTVTITDANIDEAVTLTLTTGIDRIVADLAKVYPIPSTGILYIETSAQNATYNIYDICGKLVKQQNMSEFKTRVDISSYEKGIYLVEVISGSERFIERIVLQ